MAVRSALRNWSQRAAIELNLRTRNTGITEQVPGRTTSCLLSFNAVPHLERPDRAHAISHS
jgi:hypothetical protein